MPPNKHSLANSTTPPLAGSFNSYHHSLAHSTHIITRWFIQPYHQSINSSFHRSLHTINRFHTHTVSFIHSLDSVGFLLAISLSFSILFNFQPTLTTNQHFSLSAFLNPGACSYHHQSTPYHPAPISVSYYSEQTNAQQLVASTPHAAPLYTRILLNNLQPSQPPARTCSSTPHAASHYIHHTQQSTTFHPCLNSLAFAPAYPYQHTLATHT